MKKFLLLVIFLLSACASVKSPEPTKTATPKETLIPEQAQKLVQELLENNNGCRLPCWWGITPGKTTWVEARNFLASFAVYIGESGRVRVPLPSSYSNAKYLDHEYFIRDGIIDYIRIYNFNLAPKYFLPSFLDIYGHPSEIWIRTFANEDMGIQDFMVDLFYQDKGILIEYGSGDPLKEIVGKLQNCFIKDMDSPFIYLWSPEKQNLSFQDAKQKFLDTKNLPEPLPLETATGMDIKTFYETFKNPRTDVCLETPKNLWP